MADKFWPHLFVVLTNTLSRHTFSFTRPLMNTIRTGIKKTDLLWEVIDLELLLELLEDAALLRQQGLLCGGVVQPEHHHQHVNQLSQTVNAVIRAKTD